MTALEQEIVNKREEVERMEKVLRHLKEHLAMLEREQATHKDAAVWPLKG